MLAGWASGRIIRMSKASINRLTGKNSWFESIISYLEKL
jgi:hypothetical protein